MWRGVVGSVFSVGQFFHGQGAKFPHQILKQFSTPFRPSTNELVLVLVSLALCQQEKQKSGDGRWEE